jgi:hypothetical protein
LSAATGVFNCLTFDNVEGAREARAAAVAGLARVSFLMGPQSPATSSAETLMKALTEVIKHPEDKNWAKRFEGADPFDGFYAAVCMTPCSLLPPSRGRPSASASSRDRARHVR